MLKLYKVTDTEKLYWETWDNGNGSISVHWGELGTRGYLKKIKTTVTKTAAEKVQPEIDEHLANGYVQIEDDAHVVIIIEYAIDGMGTVEDVDKRHSLESRLNDRLGWTGLGACDGGSIGSGSMEIFNFVVDFELAKQVIENDLKGTEFANYTRIYGHHDE